MLYVDGSGTTTVTVTLYEKATIPTPYFTWWVQRKGSLDTIIFYQDDISLSPYYFNQFNITIATSSVGLTSGVVPLTSGEWNYVVYQQNAPYILATSSVILETGLLIVEGTYSTPPYYNNDNPSISPAIKVYRG